ncbi:MULTISPECIES: alpha/beta hydrolase [unclassified Pseudomonas]|uniref:alpha/beta hydrolase n=1 Tax=unclassified Pseudomonas TaxID=196821 RepID=UPI000C86995F|nr:MULTISPECIES: alpha/beta hydrolase [unclassified Pseudomonas]PMV27361.1 lipase [Pseudomonas sp. FW305-3-2-15-C-TSA2]PMV32616.1 lipase [Pseudomonas sp. DP16D-L5]PMV42330.1 lipase [Pseudomonas sp. FW305-3-2-15-A-LB2]PMV49631.1 lipase [Pseudomonas sp. FW305-3-2-15-C-R2A1]PMV55254.1 lipase [Pseudomonas sp. FW305-3-2-15-C-LB1]
MNPYPISPELAAFVARTESFTSDDTSLAGVRNGYDRMCLAFTPPVPEGLTIADFSLAGVSVRSYLPTAPTPLDGWPCLLYMHGGGWVVGGLDSHDFICFEPASTLQVLVIAIDYRLAPEHPFPAAYQDCRVVWQAIQAGQGPHAINRQRLVVIGDSAGGNLAAALCLGLRDDRQPLPLAQVLIYPGLGGPPDLPSRRDCADAPLLSSADTDCYLALYLQGSGKPIAYAMPLLANDFSGLPRALIAVAQFDPLRDDGMLYAERLQAAGVSTVLYPGKGLVHGCLRARRHVPEVDRLYDFLLDYLGSEGLTQV